jgi:hypothetical protein
MTAFAAKTARKISTRRSWWSNAHVRARERRVHRNQPISTVDAEDDSTETAVHG